MSKIIWDAVGEHKYENGVDHGVLYALNQATSAGTTWKNGVPWNGLTSVSQSPDGAEPTAIYADNIKYLNILSVEDFKATVEAYTYPDEFAECDGSAELVEGKGVYIDQQPRKPFCLAYRTKIGNDLTPDAGYKIHIIYNALAAPSERSYETINDSPEAMTFSWELSTTPVEVEGMKPTAHLVLDSTKVPADKLAIIEKALFGGDGEGEDPHILMPSDIIGILNQQEQLAAPTLDDRERILTIFAEGAEKVDVYVSSTESGEYQLATDGGNITVTDGVASYDGSSAYHGTTKYFKAKAKAEGKATSEFSSALSIQFPAQTGGNN